MSKIDNDTDQSVPYGGALYLGVVQFFFACTWVVYVIYLPSLLETAGVAKGVLIWVLMIDQVVFAVMDLAMGLWADRVTRALRRLAPALVTISAVSSVAFLAMPFAALLGKDGPFAAPMLLGLLILIWTATSSALRAPLWVLVSKYAATPSMPWLSALSLSGLAISGALASYLGIALRGVDPRLPFAVSALTLLAAAAGLVAVERRVARRGAASVAVTTAEPAGVGFGVAAFYAGCICLAVGFQAHVFLNSNGQYLRFAKPADLQYLLPVFWIGFNLLMFPGAAVAKRCGALPVITGAAALGVIAMMVAGLAGNLATLTAAQFVAGGAWGAVMMAAFAGSMALGHKGREGLMVGALSSILALAAFIRMAAVAAEATKAPAAADVLRWLPPGLWLVGGLALLAAAMVGLRSAVAPRPRA